MFLAAVLALHSSVGRGLQCNHPSVISRSPVIYCCTSILLCSRPLLNNGGFSFVMHVLLHQPVTAALSGGGSDTSVYLCFLLIMQIEPAYLVKPVVLTCKQKYPPMISSAAETAFFWVLLCSLTQRTHLRRELQKQEPKPRYGARALTTGSVQNSSINKPNNWRRS